MFVVLPLSITRLLSEFCHVFLRPIFEIRDVNVLVETIFTKQMYFEFDLSHGCSFQLQKRKRAQLVINFRNVPLDTNCGTRRQLAVLQLPMALFTRTVKTLYMVSNN